MIAFPTQEKKWQRVSKNSRCPICDHIDWCLLSSDGNACICARIDQGSVKRCGESGWLHRLSESAWRPSPVRRFTIPIRTTPPNMATLALQCLAAMTPNRLAMLSHSLGLSVESMTRLEVGWHTEHNAYTFPMKNAIGATVGIRLRRPNGFKFSVSGSRNALFVPTDLATSGALLICEGPTDAAAMLDLGFAAVGRASCGTGVRDCVELVRRKDYREVVIVGDDDEPGRRGAEALASTLCVYHPCVRIIFPPAGIKDTRVWKIAGATHADIQRSIDASMIRRATLRVRVVSNV